MNTEQVIIVLAIALFTLFILLPNVTKSQELASGFSEFIDGLFGKKEVQTSGAGKVLGELFSSCAKIPGDDCLCDVSVTLKELDLRPGAEFQISNVGNDLVIISRISPPVIIKNAKFCFIESDPPYVANWIYEEIKSRVPSIKTDVPITVYNDKGLLNYKGKVLGLGFFNDNTLTVLKYNNMLCISGLIDKNVYDRSCKQLKQCLRPDTTNGFVCKAAERCDGKKDPFYTGEGTCCSIPCVKEGTER